MQSDATGAPRRRASAGRFLLVLFLLAIAYGCGYLPQWLQARKTNEQLKTTRLELRLANVHRLLGRASHEAQRNNFSSASEAARRFFEECAAITQSEPFTDEPRTLVALQGYAQRRDAMMTLLAAADPTVKEQLANLYMTMDGVLGRRGVEE
jgi:hypothetical protein